MLDNDWFDVPKAKRNNSKKGTKTAQAKAFSVYAYVYSTDNSSTILFKMTTSLRLGMLFSTNPFWRFSSRRFDLFYFSDKSIVYSAYWAIYCVPFCFRKTFSTFEISRRIISWNSIQEESKTFVHCRRNGDAFSLCSCAYSILHATCKYQAIVKLTRFFFVCCFLSLAFVIRCIISFRLEHWDNTYYVSPNTNGQLTQKKEKTESFSLQTDLTFQIFQNVFNGMILLLYVQFGKNWPKTLPIYNPIPLIYLFILFFLLLLRCMRCQSTIHVLFLLFDSFDCIEISTYLQPSTVLQIHILHQTKFSVISSSIDFMVNYVLENVRCSGNV